MSETNRPVSRANPSSVYRLSKTLPYLLFLTVASIVRMGPNRTTYPCP